MPRLEPAAPRRPFGTRATRPSRPCVAGFGGRVQVTGRQAGRQTDRQMDGNRLTDRRQTGRQAGRQTDRQTGRQTDRRTTYTADAPDCDGLVRVDSSAQLRLWEHLLQNRLHLGDSRGAPHQQHLVDLARLEHLLCPFLLLLLHISVPIYLCLARLEHLLCPLHGDIFCGGRFL